MSMSTMGENAEIQIPNGWSGQIDTQPSLDSNRPLTNAAITAALQKIDHDIEQLLALRGSLTQAGLVQVTDATDVTDSTGLALSARQNNASASGTLANKIEKTKKEFYSLIGGISIPKAANLGSYKTVGNYFCDSNEKASSLLDCPIKDAFTMKVEFSTGLGYPSQTVRKFFDGTIYYRFFDGANWSKWSVFSPELM